MHVRPVGEKGEVEEAHPAGIIEMHAQSYKPVKMKPFKQILFFREP